MVKAKLPELQSLCSKTPRHAGLLKGSQRLIEAYAKNSIDIVVEGIYTL